MCRPFEQMDCYILAGGQKNPETDFAPQGEISNLEAGYRRYAAIFDRVKLVIKEKQAKDQYLNYPHVCDGSDHTHFSVGVTAALRDADQEAIFIGSTQITDFPLELPVNLIKNYNGEPFLGYKSEDSGQAQPLFGIYSKKALEKLFKEEPEDDSRILRMLSQEGRLLSLPSRN